MRFPSFADLDKDQRMIYVEAPKSGAILVTGPPGTGKTVIAMHRALRLAADGRDVTIMMFGKVLSKYTSNFDGMPNNVKVKNAHIWFPDWYKAAFGLRIPKVDKFNFDWLEIRSKISKCDDVTTLRKLSWGHLVIDEGQDFPPEMYRALMALVTHRILAENERPTLTVFADDNQTIFANNSTISELIEELNTLVQSKRLWRLDKNYRNSLEIARFSKHFQVRGSSGVKLPDRDTSQLPQVVLHRDVDSPYDQIVRFATNFGALEVGVIVFGKIPDVIRSHANIKRRVTTLGLDCRVQGYVSKRETAISDVDLLKFDNPPSITVVHSQSAKGLEFDAVFLVNLNALQPRDEGELDSFKRLYVASSRARDHLFLLFSASVQDKFMPDAIRLLPSPSSHLCEYISGYSEGDDFDSLFDLVDWCDSAYQYQRAKLIEGGLIDRIINVNKEHLISELKVLANKSFSRQGVSMIVEDRTSDREGMLDLVIELGVDRVASALLLE